jgi:hypothetical protein
VYTYIHGIGLFRGTTAIIPGRQKGRFLYRLHQLHPLNLVQAQSTLILPTPLSLSSLPTLVQEIVGFFIVESHVLRTTRGFRSEREVDELWENVVRRVGEGMGQTLANETDPEVFLDVKESLIAFSATLEVAAYLRLIAWHDTNSVIPGLFIFDTAIALSPYGSI